MKGIDGQGQSLQSMKNLNSINYGCPENKDAFAKYIKEINAVIKKQAKATGHGKNKKTIFWDIDDVVLESSKTIIDMINKLYRRDHGLKDAKFKDLKDWGYKSIYRELNEKDVVNLFESDEFINNVKINPDFKMILDSGVLGNFNNCFVTYGTNKSLKDKAELLEKELGDKIKDFLYIGLTCGADGADGKCHPKERKEYIDMSNGIQIDDNFNFMKNTNAGIKVLVTNGINTDYNYDEMIANADNGEGNVYKAYDLKEVWSLLDFFGNYGDQF